MRIKGLEFFPVSVPYTHRERSSQVDRDGVTDVLVKATADSGITGWGESCTGADASSLVETLRAMAPFVEGHDPWESEWIRESLWHTGLWNFRRATASFAYAGIDMALWDLCGKSCGQPLYKLLGGRVRETASYFYYLSWGDEPDLEAQCRDGLDCGYRVFYLKVGKDVAAEEKMVAAVRAAIGPDCRLRLDANGAWSVAEALKNLDAFAKYDIEFIEQPVPPDPIENMREVRARCRMAVCANEGLWSSEDAYRHITNRTADVYCFSPYWVGSLLEFQRLADVGAREGLKICKHTHGELGIAAAACHHVLITLSNIVEGNQQTAQMMRDDILLRPLPISSGPNWGTPQGAGLGIEVDEEKVRHYHARFLERGQYLPYDESAVRGVGRS